MVAFVRRPGLAVALLPTTPKVIRKSDKLADVDALSDAPEELVGESRHAKPFALRFISPLYLGSALNPVNSSLIATALVPIALSLHVPVGQTSILVASLYLACAIAQPTAGKLSEELGPRRVFLSGILVVIVGGVIGGVGHSLVLLVVSRVLIGVGTSAGYPSAMVLIRRRAQWAGMAAPPGGVLGGIAIAGTVTAAVGPPIGGVLVDATSWRAAFLVNVPVGLIALAMAARWIPRDRAIEKGVTAAEIARRIDVFGIAIFACAMAALLVFLLDLPGAEWAFLGGSAVFFVVLVCWELRASAPFIDMRLLVGNLPLTRTYLRGGLSLLGVYTILYSITQWLEAAHGYSAQEAGLLILPMGALAAVISRPIAAREPRSRAADRRRSHGTAWLDRGAAIEDHQPGNRDRRGDAALRCYHRHGVRVQPNRALPAGAGEAGWHRVGPLSDLQLHRLDRVGDDQQHRLPQEGLRPWSPSDRLDPDRGECCGLAHDSG